MVIPGLTFIAHYMKTLLTFLLPWTFPLFLSAQWCEQDSGTNEVLDDVFFFDSLNGWIISSSGVVHTVDGGENWLSQPGPDGVTLYGIQFTSPLDGWLVAASADTGRLYHSHDGGGSWAEATTGFTGVNAYSDLFFTDSLHGWLIGYYNEGPTFLEDTTFIFRTSDGGDTWQKANLPFNAYNVIFFTDTLNGWIGGYYDDIKRTTDGGVSWISQSLPGLSAWFQIEDIYFTDPDHGWASGRHFPLAGGGMILQYQTSTGWVLNANDNSYGGIYFADSLEGWVTTSGIRHTTDGGANWQWEFGPTSLSKYLYALSFSYGKKGWACGENGTVVNHCLPFKIDDYDELPVRTYPNPARDLVTVEFSSLKPGMVEFLLFDCSGRLVQRCSEFKNYGENKLQIQTSRLKSGMYSYMLKMNEHLSSGKISLLN